MKHLSQTAFCSLFLKSSEIVVKPAESILELFCSGADSVLIKCRKSTLQAVKNDRCCIPTNELWILYVVI